MGRRRDNEDMMADAFGLSAVWTRFYPHHVLRNPTCDRSIVWNFDPKNTKLQRFIETLRGSHATRLGTRSTFDTSEELIVEDQIAIQLSYLAPYAALNFEIFNPEIDAQLLSSVRTLLSDHGYRVLSNAQLRAPVSWFVECEVSVWEALFVPDEATVLLEDAA